MPDVKVARAAQEAGIAGLAFLRGIPGAIGGALRMNGGAYGRETKDALIEARGVDRARQRPRLSNADMHLHLPPLRRAGRRDLHAGAVRGRAGRSAPRSRPRWTRSRESREATQPIKSRTGGSTFKNPPGHKAWQLIDAAGCRGLVVGDAQVSEMHCNFLINRGNATAADIETLGETVRQRVKSKFRRRAGMGDQADRRRVTGRPVARRVFVFTSLRGGSTRLNAFMRVFDALWRVGVGSEFVATRVPQRRTLTLSRSGYRRPVSHDEKRP